jgi:rhamnosyltransferase
MSNVSRKNDGFVKSTRTAAVIVTFNPDIVILDELISAAAEQCPVWLVDNGSESICLEAIERSARRREAYLLKLGDNLGIAAAQNRGICAAQESMPDLEFILTLDHDSSVPRGMVSSLEHAFDGAARRAKVAAVGPILYDSRANVAVPFHTRRGVFVHKRLHGGDGEVPFEVDGLNSSGSLLSVEALRSVGLFDEELFIDHVETEWCFRAKAAGYRLYGCPCVRMVHRMGIDARKYWLFGWHLWPIRPPNRHYYIFRNSVLLQRRAYIPFAWKLLNIGKLLLTFLVFGVGGSDSGAQRLQMSRGLRDGLRGPKGRSVLSVSAR